MAATLTVRTGAIQPSRLLRLVLLADAAASGGLGLLMLAGAGVLAGPLGLSAALLQGAGAICIGWAMVVGWMGRRALLPAWAVWAAIGLNLCWVADSLLLLASGWVSPTALGTAFVLVQAAAVLGFSVLQWAGLRRSAG